MSASIVDGNAAEHGAGGGCVGSLHGRRLLRSRGLSDHQDHFEVQSYNSMQLKKNFIRFGGRLRAIREAENTENLTNGSFTYATYGDYTAGTPNQFRINVVNNHKIGDTLRGPRAVCGDGLEGEEESDGAAMGFATRRRTILPNTTILRRGWRSATDCSAARVRRRRWCAVDSACSTRGLRKRMC